MTTLWLLKRLLRPLDVGESGTISYSLVLPAALFLTLVGLQMVPLPPSIEAVISPSTFEVYQKSLPGWPTTSVPDHIAATSPDPKALTVLPTSGEVASGVDIPFVKIQTRNGLSAVSKPPLREGSGRTWRPLSLDNTVTGPALLKLIAYLCFFLLVVSCPSGEKGKANFARILLCAALMAGVLVAAIALLERISSNGKAIWVFAPHDWPSGSPWGARATGPFANPDHLACYLDLVLPIALAGFLMPAAFVNRRLAAARLSCAAALIVMTTVLLLTASRGGWLGALFGFAIFCALSPKQMGQHLKIVRRISSWAGFGLFVIVVFLAVGPAGRIQTDSRFEETVSQTSIVARLEPAKASLKMIGDFPAFGIGLGCWPEFFPRYAKPPWSPTFWNATHNDYAQLTAETGLLGFVLLACFFAVVIHRVYEGIRLRRPEATILIAACVAGICSAAVHEFFDFPLQIPANALLFTTLLAVSVRLTRHKPSQVLQVDRKYNRFLCGTALPAAIVFLAAAIGQSKVPFPYSLKRPANLAQAYTLENRHPANSRVHLMLARMLGDENVTGRQIQELQAALWLEPTNPLARDLYAKALFTMGKKEEAFAEIRQSVFYSPTLVSHAYLQPRILAFLSSEERVAVESGFGTAVAAHYEAALQNFAQYYDQLGDFSAEAALYINAAKGKNDRVRRAEYFVDAGRGYAKATELKKAEAAFQAAAVAEPQESTAYEQMMLLVLAPQKNLAGAKAAAAQGISAGADPFGLYLALGSAAQMSGYDGEAQAALQKAAAIRPSSLEAVLRIGELDLTTRNFDRAASWLRKATRLDPSSAEAFYQLGLAEEGAYEYFAAEKAYERALALAPADENLKAGYAQFRQKIAQAKRDGLAP